MDIPNKPNHIDETYGETLHRLPMVEHNVKDLFNKFNDDLRNILINPDAARYYQKMMFLVIQQREIDLGNVVYSHYFGNTPTKWYITTEFEEIVEKYGGTILFPLVDEYIEN